MSWQYGDPIILGETELEVGSDDYELWSELAEMIAGDNEDEDESEGE